MHGQLEGKDDGNQQNQVDEGDLPSPAELAAAAYLLPSKFRRVGADFDKGNVNARWLKGMMQELYRETTGSCVSELNLALTRGKKEYLINDDEELKERRILRKFFELTKEDEKRIEDLHTVLEKRCLEPREHKIPTPAPLPVWPEVDPLGPERVEQLMYEPLVDLTKMQGATAADAQAATKIVDSTLLGLASGPTSFPAPRSEPDLGGLMVVEPPEINLSFLSPYEPLEAPLRKRPKIPAVADPFPSAFFFTASFDEDAMPAFEIFPGDARSSGPRPVPLSWLHPPEGPKKSTMPPLLDYPLWPC